MSLFVNILHFNLIGRKSNFTNLKRGEGKSKMSLFVNIPHFDSIGEKKL